MDWTPVKYCSGVQSASARKWRPFRPTPPIRTPRRHPTGVQISNHQESGRHTNRPQASNPPYNPNLDATPATDWRPILPRSLIWTPRQPPTGVHSAIHLQSGRRADTQQASKSAITKNLDATPTPNRRPIRPRSSIWTPRQHPTGVQSALQLKSGRRANHRLASNPPYNPNLDATPTAHWRPFRPRSPIWTPRLFTTGVQISNHQESGRRHSP